MWLGTKQQLLLFREVRLLVQALTPTTISRGRTLTSKNLKRVVVYMWDIAKSVCTKAPCIYYARRDRGRGSSLFSGLICMGGGRGK